MRKFPVGRWAVYFGLLPDVEYSVENGRTDEQRARVMGFNMDFGDLQYEVDLVGWEMGRAVRDGRPSGSPHATDATPSFAGIMGTRSGVFCRRFHATARGGQA